MRHTKIYIIRRRHLYFATQPRQKAQENTTMLKNRLHKNSNLKFFFSKFTTL